MAKYTVKIEKEILRHENDGGPRSQGMQAPARDIMVHTTQLAPKASVWRPNVDSRMIGGKRQNTSLRTNGDSGDERI